MLPAPRLPSSRPDTASFRSCLLLPPGFLGTREAGTCAGSRALSSPLSPPSGSSCADTCPVVSGGLLEISLQAVLKCEAVQLRKIVFGLFHIPCVCTVLDHLFGVRLGTLEMCHVLVHRGLPTIVDNDSTNFPKTVSLCDV